MNPNEQQSSKKWLWVGLGIFFVLLLLGGLFWYLRGGEGENGSAESLFPFGAPDGSDTVRGTDDTERKPIGGDEGSGYDTGGQDKLFRQLTNVPIAGAYALERGGVQYVRYIERETGHAYEIAVEDGGAQELTNTTIPRIAFANWADNGNAVVLRYLEEDPLSGREIVKTHLARLPALSASSTGSVGELATDLLPDDIIALSVASDGKDLFYLTKRGGETSGSIVNINTRTTKEVFRNSFSEWLPQLLDDDTIIMTTKPSGKVPGYSYRYDPKTKLLKRLVRERDGLTTLGNPTGSRVLYGENVSGNAILGVHNPSGFSGDEGTVFYESTLPLTTLPEKCSWRGNTTKILCGAFITTPRGLVPDLWYQGTFFFSDTFWSVDADTGEIVYLADPKEETGQEFDVMDPMLSKNDAYFIFTNKRDGTLWSMRIPQKIAAPEETATLPLDLTPDELQDAQGGSPQ